MPAKAQSQTIATATPEADQHAIDRVLSFWFREQQLNAPQIDQRMDLWFSEDSLFDEEVRQKFAEDVESASAGALDQWGQTPRGRLALIILLDQFRRNIYRGSAQAFALDAKALKLCVEGAMENLDKGLSPIEKVFFYMPLQHSESQKVQAKSVALYQRLAEAVTPTYRETFETIAHFAELHADIIETFGRFPHRNALLGRANTPEEDEYLAGDSVPDFGQSP